MIMNCQGPWPRYVFVQLGRKELTPRRNDGSKKTTAGSDYIHHHHFNLFAKAKIHSIRGVNSGGRSNLNCTNSCPKIHYASGHNTCTALCYA